MISICNCAQKIFDPKNTIPFLNIEFYWVNNEYKKIENDIKFVNS